MEGPDSLVGLESIENRLIQITEHRSLLMGLGPWAPKLGSKTLVLKPYILKLKSLSLKLTQGVVLGLLTLFLWSSFSPLLNEEKNNHIKVYVRT